MTTAPDGGVTQLSDRTRVAQWSGAEWDKLADLVESTATHDGLFGEWVHPERVEGEPWATSYPATVPIVQEVVRFAYESDMLLTDFNWPRWEVGQEVLRKRDLAALASASQRECLQYLTTMIRADRFSTGVLMSFFDEGQMLTVLRRLLTFRPGAR